MSTLVKFRGRGFYMSSGVLMVWLKVVTDELVDRQDLPPWLRQMREDWLEAAHSDAVEYLFAPLETYASDDERRDQLAQVIEATAKALLRYGEAIRVQTVNGWGLGGKGCRYTSDVPVEGLNQVAAAFLGLLRGEYGEPINAARTLILSERNPNNGGPDEPVTA